MCHEGSPVGLVCAHFGRVAGLNTEAGVSRVPCNTDSPPHGVEHILAVDTSNRFCALLRMLVH